MAIAVPTGFGIALFLTELCPPMLKRPIGVAVELLAAVPSIIFGIWGLFVLAPVLQRHVQPWLIEHLGSIPGIGGLFAGPPYGIGILTAGLVLAIMVLPFIAATTRDVFDTVPAMLKESGYGLGATTWEVIWNVVVPHSRAGIMGGVMLGLGRALGETMAVTFVIGNAHRISSSLAGAGHDDLLGHRQRIHRSGRRSLYLLAHRARAAAFPHYVHGHCRGAGDAAAARTSGAVLGMMET